MKNLQALEQGHAQVAELRRATRDLVDYSTSVTSRQASGTAKIINISPLGLMARSDVPVNHGDSLLVDLPRIGRKDGQVRWAESGRVGIEFSSPIDPTSYAQMLALMPNRPGR